MEMNKMFLFNGCWNNFDFILNAKKWLAKEITRQFSPYIFWLGTLGCCWNRGTPHCRLDASVNSEIFTFPVGHGRPHDDSSRAGCGPQAERCAPLF